MEDRAEAIAREFLDLLDTGRQARGLSERYPELGLGESYDVAARIAAMRMARGEVPVGRKLGFTNPAVQAEFGIDSPIWARLFAGTVYDLAAIDGAFALDRLPEPLIEPEIVLGFVSAPRAGMDEDAILGCVGWVAHGFEIVASPFPGWRFTAAESVVGFGVHGALLLGARSPIEGDRGAWRKTLEGFGITVARNGVRVAEGHARNVLGGPLTAVRFLIEDLARRPDAEALAVGELVTTGTLTGAPPAVRGDRWSTALSGIDVQGIDVELR